MIPTLLLWWGETYYKSEDQGRHTKYKICFKNIPLHNLSTSTISLADIITTFYAKNQNWKQRYFNVFEFNNCNIPEKINFALLENIKKLALFINQEQIIHVPTLRETRTIFPMYNNYGSTQELSHLYFLDISYPLSTHAKTSNLLIFLPYTDNPEYNQVPQHEIKNNFIDNLFYCSVPRICNLMGGITLTHLAQLFIKEKINIVFLSTIGYLMAGQTHLIFL